MMIRFPPPGTIDTGATLFFVVVHVLARRAQVRALTRLNERLAMRMARVFERIDTLRQLQQQ